MSVSVNTNYDEMVPGRPDKLDWEVCRTLGVHRADPILNQVWECCLCKWSTPLGPTIPMAWNRPKYHLQAAHAKEWSNTIIFIYNELTGDNVSIPEEEFLRSIGQTSRRTTGDSAPEPKAAKKAKRPKGRSRPKAAKKRTRKRGGR